MKESEKDIPPGYGERIKTLRNQKALTQQELASLVGVHKSQIISYEGENTFPGGWILVKLASILLTTSEYIALGDKASVKTQIVEKLKETSNEDLIAMENLIATLRKLREQPMSQSN